jgi:antitoxin component HigA of HigAB toxin-antitoxin module
MKKIFENTHELLTREEYDQAMVYANALLAEAGEKGYLDNPEADNEYTREIGRIGGLCADYEDTKIQFKEITVRGRSPLVRVLQEEMYKRDIKQKDIAKLIGINDTAFSLFMNGKRRLSMKSARNLYQKLNIDPKLILEHA